LESLQDIFFVDFRQYKQIKASNDQAGGGGIVKIVFRRAQINLESTLNFAKCFSILTAGFYKDV
jgi:hypothetical protein